MRKSAVKKMRAESLVRFKSVVLALALCVLSPASMALAFEPENLPRVDTPLVRESSQPSLGELVSFDVFGLEKTSFSALRENVPPEITEYARAAIQADSRLHYSSPAQGVLKFECANSGCNRIRAQVTRGVDGPVLWESSRLYRHCPFVRFSFQPDSKKFAYQMVEKLAHDYQSALKASTVKIEIENP
jgi:hypothetical protein